MTTCGDDLHTRRTDEPAADASAEIAVAADYDDAHWLRVSYDVFFSEDSRCLQ